MHNALSLMPDDTQVFNAGAVLLLRLPVREAIAVFIMGSQKSAPVAVTVIMYITTDTRQRGLLSVPAIIGQLTQIFVGCAVLHACFTVPSPQCTCLMCCRCGSLDFPAGGAICHALFAVVAVLMTVLRTTCRSCLVKYLKTLVKDDYED